MPDDNKPQDKPQDNAIDPEKIKAETQAAFFAQFGVKSADELKASLSNLKKLEDAQLSEQERREKEVKESLKHADSIAKERDAIQRERDAAKAEIALLKEQTKRREYLDTVGVALDPATRAMASALYDASKSSKDFDEAKFWEKAKEEHPSLFGKKADAQASNDAAKKANTAPKNDMVPLNGPPAPGGFLVDDFADIPGIGHYYPGRASAVKQ